jgi:hypothetical protein
MAPGTSGAAQQRKRFESSSIERRDARSICCSKSTYTEPIEKTGQSGAGERGKAAKSLEAVEKWTGIRRWRRTKKIIQRRRP